MKSPICPFDAKSGVLCSKCESKLESGGITRDDVEVSVRLTRLADRSQDNRLTKVIVSGDSKRERVNIEKVVKIAKAVRNVELLVEFEKR